MKNKSIILYCLILITAGCAAVWLQQYLLDQMQDTELFVVQQGQEVYYGEDINYVEKAGMDAEQMNYLDKLKLLKNEEKFSRKEIEAEASNLLTLRKASVIARKKCTELYKLKMVPFSLESYMNNWYTYRGTLYEYKDKVFGNFKLDIWRIEFIAYDESVHVEIMMDAGSGTIYECMFTAVWGLPDDFMLTEEREEQIAGLGILLDDRVDMMGRIDSERLGDFAEKRLEISGAISEGKVMCTDEIIQKDFYLQLTKDKQSFRLSFIND